MIKVKWLEQTADTGCPSMWEGETNDGKPIFIRWRWDELRAVVGNKKIEEYQKDCINILSDCTVVYFEKYSEPWLTTERLEELLKDYFIF